jgi:hypothetical protein
MTFLLSEPSYHRVVRVIVRPRWSERVSGIEDVLSVYLVNDAGEELCIAIIHGLCNTDNPSSRIAIETTNLTPDELAGSLHSPATTNNMSEEEAIRMCGADSDPD